VCVYFTHISVIRELSKTILYTLLLNSHLIHTSLSSSYCTKLSGVWSPACFGHHL